MSAIYIVQQCRLIGIPWPQFNFPEKNPTDRKVEN